MNLVIAANFDNVMSASIAQGMLESNGIESQIQNPTMNTLYPTPMSGLWDVTLMVQPSDLDKAIQLLKTHGDL
ncbi:putative signal transducing protein [uncultured Duncaniella sp.]|uniref:putative signal transducing protein n=1 Tax=uncultured Duncaniella sp. TaxID=2768039 RepID=UPI0027314499|nr:DUF2007 domain-containing protein [uncultured Duncaniella sp.]